MPGPVQRIEMRHRSVRIEMKPALAALFLWPRIPCDRERLHAAAGKRDQILLQRIDAEGVFDLEGREPSVGTICLDEKLLP